MLDIYSTGHGGGWRVSRSARCMYDPLQWDGVSQPMLRGHLGHKLGWVDLMVDILGLRTKVIDFKIRYVQATLNIRFRECGPFYSRLFPPPIVV